MNGAKVEVCTIYEGNTLINIAKENVGIGSGTANTKTISQQNLMVTEQDHSNQRLPQEERLLPSKYCLIIELLHFGGHCLEPTH